MSGLLIFARVHPECAGPGAAEDGLLPVEVDPSGAVRDTIAELVRMEAVRQGVHVELEWQGKRLAHADLLADVGLSPQSVFCVVPPRNKNRRVGAGSEHSAAVLPDGSVAGWGANFRGKNQDPVPSIPGPVVEIALGERHTVALLEDGSIMCWGDDKVGQCRAPEHIKAVQISAGPSHTLALLEGGGTIGWGDSRALHTPPDLGGGKVVQVSAGSG
eukprot:Hpha_TRINITY_DN32081_c0_g1::TRINITY_DN32081_c0_g1_i1::g.115800::m.115800